MIYVTKPFLPDLDEVLPYLDKIWSTGVVTNCGPLHNELEIKIAEYLDVQFVSLFSNATIALMIALKALDLKGKVITTPFSFVATSHALLWNRLEPVFVDIELDSLNLDPNCIPQSIAEQASAILPVHVYGTPCNYEEIEKIADKNGLKVLYDAAHAFGVNCHCGSLLNHGDLSVLSFHATKVFNTFEGGAIISHSEEMKNLVDRLRNFGHVGEETIIDAGLNGKMSEFNAAVGLTQLNHVHTVFSKRKNIFERYCERLFSVDGIRIVRDLKSTKPNYSYFPLRILDEFGFSRDELYLHLKANGIHSRKYFFPLISNLPDYSHLPSASPRNLPNANSVASQILCLPIYPSLDLSIVDKICDLIVGIGK